MAYLLKVSKKKVCPLKTCAGRLGGEHESPAGLAGMGNFGLLIDSPLCKAVPEGYKITFTALYIKFFFVSITAVIRIR